MSRKSSFVGKANNANQIDESSKDFKVNNINIRCSWVQEFNGQQMFLMIF